MVHKALTFAHIRLYGGTVWWYIGYLASYLSMEKYLVSRRWPAPSDVAARATLAMVT